MKMKHAQAVLLLLCFLKGISLESGARILAMVGKKVTLPCGKETQGDIVWNRNGVLVLKYVKYKRLHNNAVHDVTRFSVNSHTSNNLEVTGVKLVDSGTYTCLKDKTSVHTRELYVAEVSASPSFSLIMSEDLTLKVVVSPEQVPGLQVSWTKDGKEIDSRPSFQMKNVSVEDSGDFQCTIKIDGASENQFQGRIQVNGFFSSPTIMYSSGSQAVTIPMAFNFDVRRRPIELDAKAVEGKVIHSSRVLKNITINNGAPCWSDDCDSKLPQPRRLDVLLSNPTYGDYQMEVLLELDKRQRWLQKYVCLASLKVSSSEDEPTMESTVTLLCDINCLDENAKLCWYHMNLDQKICGHLGQKSLKQKFLMTPERVGNWTCSVIKDPKIEISANVTLESNLGLLDTSNFLFWVIVGVCVFFFLLIVVAISIVTARCRRMRRARQRAWLMQNIQKQKMCECRGFSPTRLKENA